MRKWRHSLRSAAVSIALAYVLFAQAFLSSIVVTEAIAAGDVNIICLNGGSGSHGGKLPVSNGTCVLCSLSACSASAGAALVASPATFVPPLRTEIRVAHKTLAEQQLPQPYRTPKLSQAPPQAV